MQFKICSDINTKWIQHDGMYAATSLIMPFTVFPRTFCFSSRYIKRAIGLNTPIYSVMNIETMLVVAIPLFFE